MTLTIKNAYVITLDRDGRELDGADIVVDGERIVRIGVGAAGEPAGSDEVIDGRDLVAMPGLVNAHLHSNENFEKGMYDNMPLEVWMLWAYPAIGYPALSPRDIYLRTMLTCIEQIRCGVTAVQDDVFNPRATPETMSAVMQAYADSGLRGWVTAHFWDKPLVDALPFVKSRIPAPLQERMRQEPGNDGARQLELFHETYRKWHGHDGRLRVILAPSGPQRCSTGMLEHIAGLSEELDLPIHTHVLETKVQAVTGQELHNKTLVRFLDDIGLLGRRTTLVHAIWLTAHDIELMGRNQCSIVHNPLSNLKLGSGAAPLRELMSAGVNIGIGTDGTSTSDTPDMIEALRVASLMHKIGTHDYDRWISAKEAIRMATLGSARTSLMESEVGSLEPGKRADIVLLDRRHWGFVPFNDPQQQIAFSITSEAVRTSIVNGRTVMRDRRLATVDEDTLKSEIVEAAHRFRRDSYPAMAAGAEELLPYLRAMHYEATARDVPGLRPLREAPVVQRRSEGTL